MYNNPTTRAKVFDMNWNYCGLSLNLYTVCNAYNVGYEEYSWTKSIPTTTMVTTTTKKPSKMRTNQKIIIYWLESNRVLWIVNAIKYFIARLLIGTTCRTISSYHNLLQFHCRRLFLFIIEIRFTGVIILVGKQIL